MIMDAVKLAPAHTISRRGEGPNLIDIRISASRLFNLSKVLGVSVSFFFEELPERAEAESLAAGGDDTDCDCGEPEERATLSRRETLELVRAYYRIAESPVRRRAFELIKALGGEMAAMEEA